MEFNQLLLDERPVFATLHLVLLLRSLVLSLQNCSISFVWGSSNVHNKTSDSNPDVLVSRCREAIINYLRCPCCTQHLSLLRHFISHLCCIIQYYLNHTNVNQQRNKSAYQRQLRSPRYYLPLEICNICVSNCILERYSLCQYDNTSWCCNVVRVICLSPIMHLFQFSFQCILRRLSLQYFREPPSSYWCILFCT